MDTGKVVLGALAGLATGAILGILFAPEKGTVTRKKITDKGKYTAEELKTKYNDLIDKLSSKLETVKKDGLNYYDEGKDLAQNAKRNLENSVK
jgi:gas vesicle protein